MNPNKPRGDSVLHRLKPEQRALLDDWLFAQNHAYREVARRCEAEFQVSVSRATVGKYHQRERARWDLEHKARACLASNPAATTADPETRYRLLLDKMLDIALSTANASGDPAEHRVVSDFAKVFIASRREGHEALRAATTREKFEFDSATACLIHHHTVRAIADDQSLDDSQRIQKIREELFGPNLPQ